MPSPESSRSPAAVEIPEPGGGSSPRHIGLIANSAKEGAAELTRHIAAFLAAQGVQLHFDHQTARKADFRSDLTVKEMGDLCEAIIVLGGDGTILTALHRLGQRIPPLLGINLGTLGFLTCASVGDCDQVLKAIVERTFRISPRTLLDVRIEREGRTVQTWRALNEAVISRGEISRLVTLRVSIGDLLLTEYHADGLIVATPTGSTAYSLSAGGPILMPESGVFVVNPICPHVLTNRPVIVDHGVQLTVEPIGQASKTIVTVDGQADRELMPGDRVRISRGALALPLGFLPEMSFFDVLREKLKWSGSAL